MRPTEIEPDVRQVRMLRRCQGAVHIPGMPARQMAEDVTQLTAAHEREAPHRS